MKWSKWPKVLRRKLINRRLSALETEQCSEDKTQSDATYNEDQKCIMGGTMQWGVDYLQNKGLSLEKDYFYAIKQNVGGFFSGAFDRQIDNKCRAPWFPVAAKAKRTQCIDPVDYTKAEFQNVLKLAIYHYGAVGGSVASSCLNSFYGAGVIKKSDHDYDATPDHAVTYVGWGKVNRGPDKGLKYWIVRNSWGNSWGDNGYYFIQMADFCGIKHDYVPNCWVKSATYMRTSKQ